MTSENEPSFEEMLEALKLSVANINQETGADSMPGLSALNQARDLLSSLPHDSANLLNDFMSQRRELIQLWEQAETEDRKAEMKERIKRGLERVVQALERRPRN